MSMDYKEIREKFLDYFKAKGHRIVESSSLIPKDDPTLLFTNAGMVQFKSLFLGEKKRDYTRAASSQKCVRAGGKHNDLENVGYTPRHHTFFEMLGNFSFGDYFKEEAITWAWELLTQIYRLPKEKLHISVYKDDDEADLIWRKRIGIPSDRIVHLGEKDNFWAMGDTGPCGPCSEIYVDQGLLTGCGKPDCAPGCDCDRYLEIWNLVFTQFDRKNTGKIEALPKPNIDTGMGLERLAAVIQGVKSNYDINIFQDIINDIEALSDRNYGDDKKQDVAFRVISDHARATAFLIGDGIMPSNEGRGYVLRRIIRRAIRYGQVLGLKDLFFKAVCSKVIEIMGRDFQEIVRAKSLINGVVENEEKRFADTINYSMRVLEDKIEQLKSRDEDTIPGELAFKLYDTYGLALDIVEDVARDEKLKVDLKGFEKAMSRQRVQSQESWKGSGEEKIPEGLRSLIAQNIKTDFIGYQSLACKSQILALLISGKEATSIGKGEKAEILLDPTPFYGQAGGQVGDVGLIIGQDFRFRVIDTLKYNQDFIVHKGVLEAGLLKVGATVEAQVEKGKRTETSINHSATHLLHAALQEVLGDHVKQSGSLVSSDRLRFDFSHFTQVTPEQLREAESIVNKNIRANVPIHTTSMNKEEAMQSGAMAIFEERYGQTVRVVSIGEDISKELCGGTHTSRTGNIGLFRISTEGAVAANVRRIEAITGKAALDHDQQQEAILKKLAALIKTSPNQLLEKIDRLIKEQKEKEQEIEILKGKLLIQKSSDFLSEAREIAGIKTLALEVKAESPKDLREVVDKIKDKLQSGIIFLGAKQEKRIMLICAVTKDLLKRFKAGDIIKQLSVIVGGKGGGRPDMAQGGGSQPENLNKAIEKFHDLIKEGCKS